MRRRCRVAVCVLLVVVAGCSVLPTGSEAPASNRGTLTPAPVTGTGAATEQTGTAKSTPEVEFPPGVSPSGEVDPERLFRAHAETLANRSYTWVYRKTERANGTENVTGTTRVAVDGGVGLVENRGFRSGMNNTLYLTQERGFLRWTTDDGPKHTVRDVTVADRKYSFVRYSLRTFLPERGVETSVVEWQGQRYVRLYVKPQPPPEGLSDELVDSRLIWGFTLTAYVSPAGRVRMMAVEYNDLRAHVSWRFDYRAVGETTVREPDWVPPVRRAANRSGGTATATRP